MEEAVPDRSWGGQEKQREHRIAKLQRWHISISQMREWLPSLTCIHFHPISTHSRRFSSWKKIILFISRKRHLASQEQTALSTHDPAKLSSWNLSSLLLVRTMINASMRCRNGWLQVRFDVKHYCFLTANGRGVFAGCLAGRLCS